MTRRNPVRLWLWCRAMNVVAACGGFGSRLYLFCVGKASDNEDWGEPAEPFDRAVPW